MKYLKVFAVVMLVGLASQTAFSRTQDSDAKLAAGLQNKIYQAKVFNHGQVTTTLENSVATLTGTVDNLGAKLDAEKAARKADGVKQVVNNIQVRADDVSEKQIVEKARHEILMYHAYGIFDNINLSAQGDILGSYKVGNTPRSIRIDPGGHIWVVNRGSDSIMKLAP